MKVNILENFQKQKLCKHSAQECVIIDIMVDLAATVSIMWK